MGFAWWIEKRVCFYRKPTHEFIILEKTEKRVFPVSRSLVFFNKTGLV